ncbi:hypothetical protein [Bacillus infantis]|uniref:hypothetical protein n=1 Tax=Bacillus infantis TaxID=324767 RepID=UPI003CEAB27C
MNAVINQVAELIWKNEGVNADWCYCFVERIFDDRIQLRTEEGGRYMHILNTTDEESCLISDQPTGSNLTLLYKDGEPVISRKKLFGGYKF